MPVHLPGPSIGMRLFTLKVQCAGDVFGTFEIQYRDLCDPIHHTFQTYARVPDSLLYDAGGAMIPRPGSWILVRDDQVYLQLICGWARTTAGLGVNNGIRVMPKEIRLYRLDGVDPETRLGVFILVDEVSTPAAEAPVNYAGPGYAPFSYTSTSFSAPFTYGIWDGVNSISMRTFSDYYGSHTDYASQTVTAVCALAPYRPGGGGELVHATEHVDFRQLSVADYNINPVMNFERLLGGSYGNSFGQSVTMSENGDWHWPAQSILTGTIFDLLLYSAMPVALNAVRSESAVAYGRLRHYAGYNTYTGAGIYDTSGWAYATDRGAIHPFEGPWQRDLGLEIHQLAGVWGDAAQARVWSVYPYGATSRDSYATARYAGAGGWVYTYADHYVVRAEDTAFAQPYGIFSYLDGDGSVVWLKGVEDPKPELWRDGQKLYDMNGRHRGGQLWPRTRLGMCQARPGAGQLWPRTR
ncbi:hypothetical protein [Geothrix sp. 21YS21S-4]|uniref:hypothetical protein n=1 Tax=Geothrix sp. 21YS21S-4 TaxID=3068889 RepID=UPI0027BA9513|nr:hypothetical protein [Geothrix sp. 21YS21S-4]